MHELFNLEAPAGQFRAIALLYGVTMALRCFGFEWVADDNKLFAACLLTLVNAHIQMRDKN